jgi:hypothetical protein
MKRPPRSLLFIFRLGLSSPLSSALFSFSGSHDVGKLTVSTDLMFTSTYTKGRSLESYRNDGLNVTQNFNQWFQRQLDIERLKKYRTPEGSLMSWNIGDPNGTGDLGAIQTPQYWDSPYFVVNENYATEKKQAVRKYRLEL